MGFGSNSSVRVVEARGLCEDRAVPLSEDEQRILSEIEQQLYESDPELAREVGSTTVYTHASRNLRWAVVGFVVGLITMVLTLSVHFVFAFAGFLIMLASALYFEQNARRLGRAGIQHISHTFRARGRRNAFGTGGSNHRDPKGGDDPDDPSAN